MTVAELIEHLKTFDPTLKVFVEPMYGQYSPEELTLDGIVLSTTHPAFEWLKDEHGLMITGQ